MQQINLNIDDSYLDQVMSVLSTLPKDKVEVVKTPFNKTAFGLLKNTDKVKDPVKWQQELRTNNDSNCY
ncbi:hypothetical protein MNB_SUP05-SYMBIONT-5-360 [hydrothermal vent metagenome]|uniref:Uncharacterized protein n=1 Tax=hydrothermal vent metagenome TaxID=652676 RepID=A0A1W1E5R3_9ZZZZ